MGYNDSSPITTLFSGPMKWPYRAQSNSTVIECAHVDATFHLFVIGNVISFAHIVLLYLWTIQISLKIIVLLHVEPQASSKIWFWFLTDGL